MKEYPMIFKGPMVRAILEGRKTQTRRPLLLQPTAELLAEYDEIGGRYPTVPKRTHGETLVMCLDCPFGKIGDLIWVRETWRGFDHKNECDHVDDCFCPQSGTPVYKASEPEELWDGCKWSPSIHMPKKYARIWLEITGVCAERLQAISEEDALAEGTMEWVAEWEADNRPRKPALHFNDAKMAFLVMWDLMYGKDKEKCWDSNPLVWVIEFKKVQK